MSDSGNSNEVTVHAGDDATVSNSPCLGGQCVKGKPKPGGLETPEIDNAGVGACTDPPIYGQGFFWYDAVGGCSCHSHEIGNC